VSYELKRVENGFLVGVEGLDLVGFLEECVKQSCSLGVSFVVNS
jgi:hypothetical protein